MTHSDLPLAGARQELGSVNFPLGWLLDNGAQPIQYRATIEVARLHLPDRARFHVLPHAFPPAVTLAVTQDRNGTWGNRMLSAPSRGESLQGAGTIVAVRRLLEYGWDADSPPLLRARRLLFRLLAEDDDPAYGFELVPRKGADAAAVHRARATLREAAAATLAQAGYEKDPRLRGAATRIVDRLGAFLASPLASEPLVRVGNQRALAPEAAPPSIYSLIMLAYMPLFRTERYEVMDRLAQYLSQGAPRTAPAILVGKELLPVPHLLLGDPLPSTSVADADVPWALTWLELIARLGFLRRSNTWEHVLDRFLNDCDASGIWHARKGATTAPRSANPFTWPSFPLEPHATGEARWTDVTFRVGLIARLSGRQVNLT
ncbi:MAG: hypothetical protein WKG32_21225 [Gemmatimonadaceae bacterium]